MQTWIVVVFLLLIVLCIFLVLRKEPEPETNYEYITIKDMVSLGRNIVGELPIVMPNYKIRESTAKTQTLFTKGDIPTIEIIMRKPSGELYDKDTLVIVYLHEMAHIICQEPKHGPKFLEWEDMLIKKAQELGHLQPDSRVDNTYPQKVD